MHRPDVPERLRAGAAARAGSGQFFPVPSRPPVCLQGSDGSDDQSLRRAMEQFAKHRRSHRAVRKGQRKDDVAAEYRKQFDKAGRACCSSARRRRRRRCSAPSGGAMSRPEHLPLAGALHGHGQPLLRLLHGPGLRSLLPEVLHLLPLQRQALPERSRVRQAPTGQAGHRLQGAG